MTQVRAQQVKTEEAEHQATEMDCNAGLGLIRTFLIFLDLPVHFEFRSQDMPLIPEGTAIHFRLSLRNPKDPKRVRDVDGEYVVKRRKLIYTTQRPSLMGLSQYLELELNG
jgi:hypothetical protein